ncbi:MAG: EVE domain-containing protein [Candidatus Limnocylindria bacterium]
MPEPGAYWMIVTSVENYEATRRRRFTIQGVKSRHRRKAERMRPGDRVCWFLTGRAAFAATATITSEHFEGTEPIWVSERTGDRYPWRFRISAEHSLAPDRAVPAAALLDELRFVRRWPREHWRLAFQGNVHELGAEDFALIEGAVAAAQRTEARAPGGAR